MPDAAELIRGATREEALMSFSDQAGELLAALVEDDRPEPHRADEFNASWKGPGGTEGFLEETAELAYKKVAERTPEKAAADEL
jgi:hypothetical protein